jgi:putative peptidoglycan lipid II flippase
MHKEDYSATMILMVGLLAATLSGFFRQASLAHHLGTGSEADIYLIAYSIPEFVIIALGIILPAAFIPLFADYRLRFGEVVAWHFGLRIAGSLGILLLVVTLLAILTAPLYLPWLAPGFEPLEYVQAVRASRLMMPAIILMGYAVLFGVALQVYRRFEGTALTNLTYNLTFVIVLFAVPFAWLVGRTAIAVVLGAAAALLIQLPFLWKHRRSFHISKLIREAADGTKQRSARLSQFTYMAGPLAIGYAMHHTIWFVDRAMATSLGVGGVATLNYAYRLALVVGQLSGLAVSTAVFPRLSEQVSAEDHSGLQTSLAGLLRFVWMIGLPATCALIVLREPMVEVFYEHGAFGGDSTIAVSQVLVWYAIAVLADAMCQPFWRVIYAWRSVWTVSFVNGIQTAIRILFNIVLIRYYGLMGIAISTMIGLTLQLIVLGWLAQRRLGINFIHQYWLDARMVIIASLIASIAMGLIANQLLSASTMITLLFSASFGCITYLAILAYSNNWRKIYSEIKSYLSPKYK